jgi:hypothetical protein
MFANLRYSVYRAYTWYNILNNIGGLYISYPTVLYNILFLCSLTPTIYFKWGYFLVFKNITILLEDILCVEKKNL